MEINVFCVLYRGDYGDPVFHSLRATSKKQRWGPSHEEGKVYKVDETIFLM